MPVLHHPGGIFTPTRVIHVTTNAVVHLQSSIAGIIPDDLKHHILIWLGDVLLYPEIFDELFESVRSFFALCVKYNLRLHPVKCTIFAIEIRWCGRVVSAKGVRYDTLHITGLLSMAPPTTGSELQQFVCALQCVKQGIPDFSRHITPLHEFIERLCDHTGKRTNCAASRVQLVTLR